MSFSEGGFADAFAEARGNKQELFTWQGNSYTTRRADETDQQYQNFLGKSVDNKVILKEEPYAPADQKEYNNVLAGNAVVDENIIIPKKKPVVEKKENIIIPKKKPIIKAKEDKGLEFPSIVSKAEAAIVEQPNKNTKAVENFAKEENENTEIISAPFRLLANSFWNKWFGKKEGDMFTNNDFDKGTVNVLQTVAKNALDDGRGYTHYTDYPLTARGVSAEALVGEYKDKDGNLYSAEYKKKLEDEVNAVYPNNIVGKAKFAYDIATDPVMKAIFSIGGFSLQKNNQGYFINERFNFNTANKTEGTALKKIRKVISNMKDAPMDENEGPEVFIKLGNIETKVALKMAKGDTPSVAWMRDYFFDGKGGYDTFMTFPEFIKGPGKQLYLDSRKKNKGGVIQKFRGGGLYQGVGGYGRSSNTSSNRSSSNINTGGSNNRERYIANQYKTKTSNKGGGNVGSGGNNNNNNNNNNKNTKKNNALEKVFDVLGSGDTSILGKTKKSTDIYNDDSWEGLDLDSGSVKSAKPETYVGPMFGYEIDNPISVEAIANKNVGARVVGGATVIGPTYKGSAYLKGATDVQNFGDIDKSFNVNFSNQSGIEVKGSYDLNNSMLSGNVSKYTNIGNTGYSYGIGADINNGKVSPSFQIRKDFKKGGLLDKKRG